MSITTPYQGSGHPTDYIHKTGLTRWRYSKPVSSCDFGDVVTVTRETDMPIKQGEYVYVGVVPSDQRSFRCKKHRLTHIETGQQIELSGMSHVQSLIHNKYR